MSRSSLRPRSCLYSYPCHPEGMSFARSAELRLKDLCNRSVPMTNKQLSALRKVHGSFALLRMTTRYCGATEPAQANPSSRTCSPNSNNFRDSFSIIAAEGAFDLRRSVAHLFLNTSTPRDDSATRHANVESRSAVLISSS